MDFGMESRRAFGDGVVTALGKVDGRDVVAMVPRITVMVRKAYGGAYIAMCSKTSARASSSPGRMPK